MQPPIIPKKIKRAVMKQTMSFKIPSGKKQAMIIKTMITLTIGTDNRQSMEIRSFIYLLKQLSFNFSIC